MIITWDITRECNLNCIHCLNADRRLSGGLDLITKDALNLINQFADYYVREIHFTGGEPFIRPDILQLAYHATERGLAVSFTTNGLLINESITEKLVDLAVKKIIISIDGGIPETNDLIRGEGTFNRVVEATKVLIKGKENSGARMEIIWSCVLLKPNLGEMRQLLSLADTLKVSKLMLGPLELLGNAKINEKILQPTIEEVFKACDDTAALTPKKNVMLSVPLPPKALRLLEARYHIDLESLRERTCSASTYSCYVTHDGLLYPCRYAPIIIDDVIRKGGLNPSQVTIDLKVASFREIYNSDLFLEFMRRIYEPGIYQEMVPCNRCEYIKTTEGLCLPKCPFSHETEVKDCLIAEEIIKNGEFHDF
jgi:MoaA/NifB/PqqE/SkfB family radical SAM enzyme